MFTTTTNQPNIDLPSMEAESQQLYFGPEDNTIGVDTSDIDLSSDHATEKILERSGLNWDVLTQDGLGEEWEYTSSVPRMSYRLFTNEEGETKKIHLGTATTRRKVFQNEDIISAIASFCNQNEIPILRVGTCDPYGVKSFAICGLDEQFFLNDEDAVKSQILVTHSHNCGSLNFGLISERLVCQNQLPLPRWVKQLSLSHINSFSKSKALDYLQQLKYGVNLFQDQATKLANQPITDLDNEQEQTAQAWVVEALGNVDKALSQQPRYVRQLLDDPDRLVKAIALKTIFKAGADIKPPEEGLTQADAGLSDMPKAFQEIMDSYYNAPGSELSTSFHTAWGALNAVTHYYTHNSAKKGGVQGHFSSLWTGSKARATQSAFNESVAVAEMLS